LFTYARNSAGTMSHSVSNLR